MTLLIWYVYMIYIRIYVRFDVNIV
jgi:hypothetical protein